MSLQRRVMIASAWAVGGKLTTVAVTLAFNILIARRVATAEVGSFFLLSSLTYVVSTIATLGINASLLRSIASEGKLHQTVDSRCAWRTVFFSSVLMGGLLSAIVTPMLPASVNGALFIATMCGLLVPIQALTLLMADVFRGRHRIALATLFDGMQGGLLPVVLSTFAMLLFPGSMLETLVGLMILMAGTSLVNLLIGLWILGPHHVETEAQAGSANQMSTAALIGHSLPFLGTTLFLLLRTQTGLWIVGAFGSAAETAVFGIAQRVLNAVMLPSMVITNALQPTVAQLLSSSRTHDLEPLLRRMATLTTLPIVAAVIAIQVGGSWLLGLVFGPEYAASGSVLQILAIGNLLFAWCGAPGLVLSMSGYQRLNMMIYGVTVAITCALGAWATSSWGMHGMAWVLGLTGVLNKLFSMEVVRRRFGIRTQLSFELPSLRRKPPLSSSRPQEAPMA